MPNRVPSLAQRLRERDGQPPSEARHSYDRAYNATERMVDDPRRTARWQALRLVVLKREPCCRSCDAAGITEPATIVDHVVPLVERRDLAFVESNLQPLCSRCSATKSADERRAKAARATQSDRTR